MVSELTQQTNQPVDHLFTATGSAGTLSGLVSGALKYSPNTKVHGVAVLKNAEYLIPVISKLVPEAPAMTTENNNGWQLHTQYHEGGYGKVSPKLAEFCKHFTQHTQIPIEPIYTGKMLYTLWQMIEQGDFAEGANIVAVHTGGLQGLAGLKEQQKF